MEKRLFSAQDTTQILRALTIVLSSHDKYEDYLIIHTTKKLKDNEQFIHTIKKLANIYEWSGIKVIPNYNIGDFSNEYFDVRDNISCELKKIIEKEFGLVKFDYIYTCRNYQIGNDLILRTFGNESKKICFGDGFGNIDILDDKKWINFHEAIAIFPRIPIEDLPEKRADLKKIPLRIIDKTYVKKISDIFINKYEEIRNKISATNNDTNSILLTLTPMTEAGMTKNVLDEIKFYTNEIIRNKELWIKKYDIGNIIIKPHPRQCNNQSKILAKILEKYTDFKKFKITSLDNEKLQSLPIEIIAPFLKIKHIESPSISASSLSLNGLYKTSTTNNNIEEILNIQTPWHHKYFIAWLNIATSLQRIANWDKKTYLNGYPPKFKEFTITSNSKQELIENLHKASKFAEENNYFNCIEVIENEISNIKKSLKMNKKAKETRVTFVAYGPNQINGPNIWLQRILPQLSKRGFTPHVIFLMNSNESCRVVANLESNGIKCIKFRQKKYTEENIIEILEIIKREKTDIFIPNLCIPAYYAATYAKIAGIPTIGILHSDDTFHHEIIDTFINAKKQTKLSAAVCVSRYIEGLALKKAASEISIFHSPYGVELPEVTSTPPVSSLKLIYTGRLIQRQKRIFDVIASSKMALNLIDGVEVAFFGEDREGGKAISAIERVGSNSKMSYGGILKYEEIMPTLAQHHVLILLSDYEGMSISLMEAMACGLVPICTRTKSGSTEIIRHNENGLLVDNREEDFLNAVRRLKTENGLWQRLSKGARETIAKEYSIDICADKWADLLCSLANKSSEKKVIQIPELHEINLPPVKQTENGMCREDKRMPRIHPPAIPKHGLCDSFLNPKLAPDFADLYIVRKGIKNSLDKHLENFHGTLLDVGCGQMPYREHIRATNPKITRYIGLDFATGKYAERRQPDLTWDGLAIPLPDASVDCAMATEVLEHCFDPSLVLQEIKRVLKPGGAFFFTVPFLWPIHDAPHDHYRYTPYALERLLAEAGFDDIRIEALGGWNASLAQMIGLWLRRAPMAGEVRAQMTKDLFPFLTELARTDVIPADFSKNPMVTGLSGTAKAAGPRATRLPNMDGPRVIVVTDQFPVLSQTFILDQMTGLMDRGLAVEHWSLQRMDEPVVHDNVRKYGLLDSTRYITLPPDALRTDPGRWTEQFLRTNHLTAPDDAASVQIHFGPNFNKLSPLFEAYPELFVLVSFHGYDGSATFKVKGTDVYTGLFARANQITTPSRFMKDTLVEHGCLADKVRVHHYGKDTTTFAPVPHHDGRRPIRLLSVARFVEKKGLQYSLTAFAKAQAGLDAQYRIIGYGPLEKELRALAQSLGVADKVVFLGQLTNDAVRQEMAEADIFVLTSVTAANGDQEGVPVSLIEAQALGLPVVSSRHAGIPELVAHGETGFLAEERNVAEIAGFMRVLIKNPKIRGEFAANARARVLREFDLAQLNDTLAEYLVRRNDGSRRKPTDDRRNATGSPEPEKEPDPGLVHCPICRSKHAQFRAFGAPPRPNALCPSCTSLERHRALWLFLERHTDFFTSSRKRMLHFAPEVCLEGRFRQLLGVGYVTADLVDPRADVRADITDLQFPDFSFDIVCCSHVLEHVPDDCKAMRELYRILDKDGLAIVMVPLRGDVTEEDLSITDPAERTRRYGQADHVRYYGMDIENRLRTAGFAVQCVDTDTLFSPQDIAAMRLGSARIFLCRKPSSSKADNADNTKAHAKGTSASASTQALRATARHWSTAKTAPRTRWWMHPAILRHINTVVCGEPVDGPWAGLERRMRDLVNGSSFARGLSVGCGSASKELHLLQEGIVERFDLFEISPERVLVGQSSAVRRGVEQRARFHAQDPFAQNLDDSYDLVYWNNALHHMFDVRQALLWSQDRLRPGGWLVMDDYVGAARFQWPDIQLEIASRVRRSLPERLLRDPAQPQRNCSSQLKRPDLAGMLATDPSEAADSDNIIPALREIFPTAQIMLTGGVVYNLALKDVIANFDDVEDGARLQDLLAYDAALAAQGQTQYACAFAAR